MGMARRRERRKAEPRTIRVAGRRWEIRVRTGERDWREVPHWPVTMDVAH